MGALSSLPALSLKPVQQPDVLDKFSQLAALRNAQQEYQQRAALAPIQQQTAQLNLQQQQQALKNQQALTAAYQQWDGKNYDTLAHLALQNGATGETVQALQQHALTIRKTASDIASADAATGSKNAETLAKLNDDAAGQLNGVLSLPPEQQPKALLATAQSLAQQKRPDGTPLLDQQHLAMAQQLASQGPQAIAQAIPAFAKSLTAFSAQLESAQKEAQTSSEKANTAKTASEMAFYAKNGGAPGVSAEIQQQADWLSKHPGKGPADYKLWVMQHSPTALVMGNQLGPNTGGQGNPALDFVAQNYLKTGQMPPELSRSPGTITAVIKRAAELGQQSGNTDLASNKADFDANKKSLDNLQKNYDQVQAFEGTAGKNLDLYLNALSKIPDLGAKFSNVPLRMLNDKMIGTANYQAMKAAQETAASEVAKVLSSANASGVLSDTQKREAEDLVSGNLTYPAAQKVVQTLKQDMANRTQAYQMQIGDIRGRIKGVSPTPQSTGLTVTAPNGKTYTFKDQQSADAFRKAAGIQ